MDLTLLLNNVTIKKLGIQGVNGNCYNMRIPDIGNRNIMDLLEAYQNLYNQMQNMITTRKRLGLPLPPYAKSPIHFYEELNQRIADEMAWSFTPPNRQGRTMNMNEKNNPDSDFDLEEFFRQLDECERGGLIGPKIDVGHYIRGEVLTTIRILQKDEEAFRKLSPEEQEEKYLDYKKEVDALSKEELLKRLEKLEEKYNK